MKPSEFLQATALREEKPLSSLAYALGRSDPLRRPDSSDNEIMSKGMGTTDFSRQLAKNAQKLVYTAYDEAARHLAFCDTVEARNFKPISMPAVDIPLTLGRVNESGEITTGTVTLAGGNSSARLYTYANILRFSRRLIINDEVDIVGRALALQGAVGARTEAGLVYAAMEANPTLDDNSPVFHADHGNIITGANLAWDSIGTAMEMLRKQPASSGNVSDLGLKHLVCAANIEVHALRAVKEAGLEGRITVTATGLLPDWRWYGLADPAISPCVAVLRLQDATYPVAVEEQPHDIEIDGVQVRARAELGAAMIGRIGIVRGQVEPAG